VIDPPKEVDVPAIVIAELESDALGIALMVNTPVEARDMVAPDPLRDTGAYAVPPAFPTSNCPELGVVLGTMDALV